jgi:hypothetical protein
MNNEKEFDCVEFQRSIREKLLNEANNDLKTLVDNANQRNKQDDMFKFLIDRENQKKLNKSA